MHIIIGLVYGACARVSLEAAPALRLSQLPAGFCGASFGRAGWYPIQV